ncbi:MAG: hypothetical protein AB7E24_04255, partial [Novosphingobium sp.]
MRTPEKRIRKGCYERLVNFDLRFAFPLLRWSIRDRARKLRNRARNRQGRRRKSRDALVVTPTGVVSAFHELREHGQAGN